MKSLSTPLRVDTLSRQTPDRCHTPDLLSSASTAPSSAFSASSRKSSYDFEHDSVGQYEDRSVLKGSRARHGSALAVEDLIDELSISELPTVHEAKSSVVFEVVGQGAHARVHRALLHGRQVAAKVALSKATERFVRREVQALDYICLNTIELDNIVEHYALDVVSGRAAMLMELADSDLMTSILAERESSRSQREPVVGSAQWHVVAKQMVSAVAALHRIGVVHGDIKPQNFLLTPEDVIKLSDFESAYTPEGTLSRPESNGWDVVGSNAYSAPELLKMRPDPSSFESDIFALGVSLLVLATGEEPYARARNGIEMIIQSQAGDPIRFTSSTSRLTPAIEEIVRGCCSKDPSRRWNAEELLRAI